MRGWATRPTALAVVLMSVLSMLTGAAVTASVAVVAAAPAQAADLSGFRAGNIISDAVFFDGDRMSETAVQSFLELKGASCSVGAGAACLKDYRVSTTTRAADSRCTGTYQGAANERASTIITKVALACGINPQAIIVILQKEQGLVTTSGAAATEARYRRAMGFGCSDTAPCDAQYGGFFNQVYQAAWQFKNYAAQPTRYAHRAGMTNNVRFSPNAACGSSAVFIENQATAGLYNYTPYQPNAAALAAGYGTGDSCSAYGNRNFWNYFTDWFGPTSGYSVSPQMTELWNTWGGAGGPLGVPTASQRCDLVPTGCSQVFSGGTVFWSPSTGAQAVGGLILTRWKASGGPGAGIGYPTSTVLGCASSGCTQTFQSGVITWSSTTGAQLVGGLIYNRWKAVGGVAAGIGYPTATVLSCDATAGCAQPFERGLITWSGATGAQVIGGIIQSRWQKLGGATSPLGYPTSTTLACPVGTGCTQSFAHGLIAWSGATGAQVVAEPLAAAWKQNGAQSAGIGLPVESVVQCTSACVQKFQSGVMAWSGSGSAQLIGGVIYRRWNALGATAAGIGYPTSTVKACDPVKGCIQTFQSGAMAWSSSTGAQLVGGLIWNRWRASGGLDAGIGLPTGSVQSCPSSGCVQTFQRGAVAWSADAGAQLVGGTIYGRWRALGGVDSALGHPTDTVLGCVPAGCRQNFTGGSITWSAATGAQALVGPILDLWMSSGAEASVLGLPTSTPASCAAASGCLQTFASGAVDWSSSRGALAIAGAIYGRWASSGGPDAGIGRPLDSSLACDQAAGCTQRFASGAISASSATGAHLVGGQIYRLWNSLGGPTSALGLPTSTVLGCDGASGCTQTFQRGAIRWSAADGARVT